MDRWEVVRARIDRFGGLVDCDPALVPLDRAALAMAATLRDGTEQDRALSTLD
jgi:hypothetical protein